MPPLAALVHPRSPLALLALLSASTAAWGQDYAFPTSAEDYPEFYPTAYKDNGGTTDWNCGDITYTGHGGTDLGVGSWAGMDAGRDVTAGADGVVVATHDGEFDRCTTADCPGGGGFGNYVQLLHPDGKSTYYGHLRQWTVAVAVGDAVSCGQKLGEVGSSGHSTGPHLHFEVRNSAGRSEDPFDGPCSAPPTYWVSQGDYAALPGLACEGAPACAPSADLTCGASITTRSDGAGSTSAHAVYGCTTWAYTGAEQVYRVATDRDEPLTLRLTRLSADLDLYVLDRPDCDGSGCLGASDGPDSSDEAVTIEARAGAAYTVVIDGFEGAASDFVLTVDCAGGWPADLDGGGGSDSTDGTDGTDGADGTSDGSGDGASDGATDGAADGSGDGTAD
ncbi:MAG: hypothetical protein RL071_2162, partial [Pseudomonadota bacterium]